MRKYLYLLLGVLLAIGLAACSEENKLMDEDVAIEEPAKEEQTETDEPASKSDELKVYQNEAFKDVVVTITEDQFVISGKAQVFEGVFEYKLYDGDNVLLEEHYQTDGAPAWGEFTIPIDKNLITHDSTLFELFVYSAKDGSKINVLEIPIIR